MLLLAAVFQTSFIEHYDLWHRRQESRKGMLRYTILTESRTHTVPIQDLNQFTSTLEFKTAFYQVVFSKLKFSRILEILDPSFFYICTNDPGICAIMVN